MENSGTFDIPDDADIHYDSSEAQGPTSRTPGTLKKTSGTG